ncbi:TPA: hypothetical protein ACH3X1_000176 [Trebouxia sp. C0004]
MDKVQLPWPALFLLNIKSRAADPEKTFSLMGWSHSARKNQLASKTTTALSMSKMYYNSLRDRDRQVTAQLIAPKLIREVGMIMQKEQLVAGFAKRKVTTKAIVAAVEASA